MTDRVVSESPNPFDDVELFATYLLGGERSPGVVTFSGHERTVEWDEKKAQGNDGSKDARQGAKPIEFEASHYLVSDPLLAGIDDQYGNWDAFAAVIESTVSGDNPKALDIYHPDLARNGIKSVVKKSIGGMVYDGKGGATIKVRYREYLPPTPKKATGASGSSSSGGGAGGTGTLADAATTTLDNLVNQAKDFNPF